MSRLAWPVLILGGVVVLALWVLAEWSRTAAEAEGDDLDGDETPDDRWYALHDGWVD